MTAPDKFCHHSGLSAGHGIAAESTLPGLLLKSSGSLASSLPRSTSGSESSLPSQVRRRARGVTSGPMLLCSCGAGAGCHSVPKQWQPRQAAIERWPGRSRPS